MDVVQDVQKVCLLLNKNLLRSALKEGTSPIVPFVEVVGVSDIYLTHKQTKTALYKLGQEQVVMISHQAPTVYLHEHLTTRIVGFRKPYISANEGSGRCRVVEFV